MGYIWTLGFLPMYIPNLSGRRANNLEGIIMQIKIPKGALIHGSVLDPKLWNDHEYLFIYALDYYCVGITPVSIPEWENCSIYKECVPCKQSDNLIRFMFPEKMYGFYHLMQKDRGFTLSCNGGIILMIITCKTLATDFLHHQEDEKDE
jgi:hypothetical protein